MPKITVLRIDTDSIVLDGVSTHLTVDLSLVITTSPNPTDAFLRAYRRENLLQHALSVNGKPVDQAHMFQPDDVVELPDLVGG